MDTLERQAAIADAVKNGCVAQLWSGSRDGTVFVVGTDTFVVRDGQIVAQTVNSVLSTTQS
jgi:hypothetical protein